MLFHGHGSYLPFEFLYLKPGNKPGASKEYAGSWVEAFNEAGYSVCGIDYQSHGRSKSLRGLRNDYHHMSVRFYAYRSLLYTHIHLFFI